MERGGMRVTTFMAQTIPVLRWLFVVLATMMAFGCGPGESDRSAEEEVTAPADSSAVHLRVNLLGYL